MRLIDADALIVDLEYDVELDARVLDCMDVVGEERKHTQDDKDSKQYVIYLLKQTPTIDAVPVIRCKDCKYRDDFNYCVYGTRLAWVTKSNDFCSKAERRR